MKLAVFITCNDTYVERSIHALNCFNFYNPTFIPFIIGTSFSDRSINLCHNNNINFIMINLERDFKGITDMSPYPIECFYHFYVYNILNTFDYLVNIEADIYTNKPLEIENNIFRNVTHIAGSHYPAGFIHNFYGLMNDYEKITKVYPKEICDITQHRILGGFRIYNPRGLKAVNFYSKIVEYYNTCLDIGCQRRGDDSLMVMYQMLNPSHFYILPSEYHIVFFCDDIINADDIYHFHFTGQSNKYWDTHIQPMSRVEAYFRDRFLHFIDNNCLKENDNILKR